MKNGYTTQREIRAAFWDMAANCGKMPRKGGHNAQTCEVRTMFCDFVDDLQKNGTISEALAQRATL